MPPFDGNLLQMPPSMSPVMGDLASSAWQLPFGDRLTAPEPSQLAFGDIFQQLAVANAGDGNPAQFEDVFKNASNIEFSSQAQNQRVGTQPDFFLNAQGKLVKNPHAEPLKPGQPLNIEVQGSVGEMVPELQGAIQSILDIFNKFHPDMPFFPRTWQEVMQMLANFANAEAAGDATGTGAGSMQRAAYDGSLGGEGGAGGDVSPGGGGGGDDRCYGTGGGDAGAEGPPANVAAVPWDGQSKGDMNLATLAGQAASQGRQLWAETQFAGVCEGGNVGCAASVSKVLQEAGYGYGNSALVTDLASQLASNGWSQSAGAETAQPGDVIYADGGGKRQHIGIVGIDENGNKVIYNNHSSTGVWTKDEFNACSIITDYDRGQVHVLHAPSAAALA